MPSTPTYKKGDVVIYRTHDFDLENGSQERLAAEVVLRGGKDARMSTKNGPRVADWPVVLHCIGNDAKCPAEILHETLMELTLFDRSRPLPRTLDEWVARVQEAARTTARKVKAGVRAINGQVVAQEAR